MTNVLEGFRVVTVISATEIKLIYIFQCEKHLIKDDY